MQWYGLRSGTLDCFALVVSEASTGMHSLQLVLFVSSSHALVVAAHLKVPLLLLAGLSLIAEKRTHAVSSRAICQELDLETLTLIVIHPAPKDSC